jgi:hypothetical protein
VYADCYGDLEVVKTSVFTAPAAIVPITTQSLPDTKLWIVHLFDGVSMSVTDTTFKSRNERYEDIFDDDQA